MSTGKTEKTDKQAMLLEMAQDMDVAMCRRYDEAEAAKILGIPEKELAELRELGQIAYLQIGKSHVGFLGQQLLAYLYECIVPVGEKPKEAPVVNVAKPSPAPEAELLSVNDTLALLGIGRTKLYELLNEGQIEAIKIGERRMIKRVSVRKFVET